MTHYEQLEVAAEKIDAMEAVVKQFIAMVEDDKIMTPAKHREELIDLLTAAHAVLAT